ISSALVPRRAAAVATIRGRRRSDTSMILTPRPLHGSDHVPTYAKLPWTKTSPLVSRIPRFACPSTWKLCASVPADVAVLACKRSTDPANRPSMFFATLGRARSSFGGAALDVGAALSSAVSPRSVTAPATHLRRSRVSDRLMPPPATVRTSPCSRRGARYALLVANATPPRQALAGLGRRA